MDQEEAMAELVYEVADELAAGALNAGEGLEFLLSNGWTREEIRERLEELTGDPESISV